MKNFEHQTAEHTELKNRQIQFNRLVEASHTAREIKLRMINEAPTENAALYYTLQPINFYLLNYVYNAKGITGFKKFNEWKQAGAIVKKGSKAFPIWGQPIGAQKEEAAESKGENYTATDEENTRFPMCYVFSNLQVATTEERGAKC
jgi:hypothetical protein